MAQLTWRNVAAPDFGSAVEANRSVAALLQSASQQAQQGINNFNQAQTDSNDRAIMANALQYTDPAQYQAALASGQITGGLNPQNISAGTMQALQARTGQLNGVASALQQTAEDKYNFARKQSDNAALDAAQPDIAAYLSKAATGDMAGANAILANSASMRGLNPQQLNTALSQGNGQVAGSIGNQKSAWNLGQEVQNLQDQKAAQALTQNMLDNSTDLDSYRRWMRGNIGSMTPAVRAIVQANGDKQFGAFSGTPTASDLTSAGVTPGTKGAATDQFTNALGVTYGGKQLPAEIQTAGQFVDNTARLAGMNDKNSSATGVFQITGSTMADFAPKALGPNWRSADMRSFDTQDKVANAIWDSAKGSATAIQGRWPSFTDAQAKAAVGKPWSEVRDLVAKQEGGVSDLRTSLREAAQSSKTATANLMVRTGEDATADATNAMAQGMADTTSSIDQVAKGLSQRFGGNEGDIAKMIQKTITDARAANGGVTLTPAAAGAAVVQSATPVGTGVGDRVGRFVRNWTPGSNEELGPNARLDPDKLKANIDIVKNGGLVKGMLANQATGVLSANIETAKAALTAETQKLAAMQQQAGGSPTPGQALAISAQQQRVNSANRDLTDYLSKQQSNNPYNPNANPVEAVPATPKPIAQSKTDNNGNLAVVPVMYPF